MSEKRIKVTDRRMFTPDGRLREEFRDLESAEPPESSPRPRAEGDSAGTTPPAAAGPGAPAPVQAPPAAPPEPREPPPHAPDSGPLPPPTFFDLVGLLAEPVALYLGDARLPDGKSAENLEMARLHIDLLDILKTKTEGNLTAQESEILVDLIYRLRLRYVQKKR